MGNIKAAKKFRKKPVVIEAVLYDGSKESIANVLRLGKDSGRAIGLLPDCLTIKTLEGTHRADIGDWIIKGIQGELYPCKPDIFEQTYEPCQLSKPRPSESRVLTINEWLDAIGCDRAYKKDMKDTYAKAIVELEAQRDLTASIIRAECQELRTEERRYFESKTTEAKQIIRQECQQRVDGVLKQVQAIYNKASDLKTLEQELRNFLAEQRKEAGI